MYDAAQGAAFFISVSAIDFRLVGALENIIDAHAVKIGEQNERFRGRDALAGFVFGKQRLLDAGRYLQGELRHFALLAEETEVVVHIYRRLINEICNNDIMSFFFLTYMTYSHKMKEKREGGGKGEKTGGVGSDGGGVIRGSRDSKGSGRSTICYTV